MRASDYYPAGAYSDPNAPYNEVEVPERDFDVDVTETLTRTATVTTRKYCPEFDEEDGHTYANTDDTNWEEVYNENFMPLSKLMEEMKKEAQLFIADIEQRIKECKQNESQQKFNLALHRNRLKALCENMDGWEQADLEVDY